MRTNNPAFNPKRLANVVCHSEQLTMTIDGTITKTAILLFLMSLSGALTWYTYLIGYFSLFGCLTIIGSVLGFILSLVTIFKQVWASKTAPLYAICQGLAMGGISAFAAAYNPGIISIVLGLTISIFASMLLLYKLEIIRVTENFRVAIIAATFGVGVSYLLSLLLSLFGIHVSLIQGGIFGGILGLIIIAIAALNLVLDFDFIVQGEQYGFPKYMEWYAAFGLLLTLVWLYIEILRFFSRRR